MPQTDNNDTIIRPTIEFGRFVRRRPPKQAIDAASSISAAILTMAKTAHIVKSQYSNGPAIQTSNASTPYGYVYTALGNTYVGHKIVFQADGTEINVFMDPSLETAPAYSLGRLLRAQLSLVDIVGAYAPDRGWYKSQARKLEENVLAHVDDPAYSVEDLRRLLSAHSDIYCLRRTNGVYSLGPTVNNKILEWTAALSLRMGIKKLHEMLVSAGSGQLIDAHSDVSG